MNNKWLKLILFVLIMALVIVASPGLSRSVSAASSTLVINEVDYDQPSTDTMEFIEIKNVSASAIDLDPYSVILWNASTGASYRTIDLPAINLAAGDYYVICANNTTVANCDLDSTPDTDFIQNGAPDALGLWLGSTLIDAVSYEGNSQAPYTEGSGTGLEDTAAASPAPAQSISRCEDGTDTDQNNVDFTLRTSTPGTTNDCPVGIVVINEFDYDQASTDTAEFVELKNVGTAPANLDNYVLELINGNGGGAVAYDTIDLPNVNLAVGDYYVICANNTTVSNCDLDDAPDTNFIQNGDPDAIGLKKGGVLVDAVSYEGNTGAPYTEGSGTGLVDLDSLAGSGLSRCPDGSDTNQNNVDFEVWPISPGAENCVVVDVAPTVSSTIPADNATNVAVDANITITFSEAVDVTGAWYTISCTPSGAVTATVSGGPTEFTLDPDSDLPNGEVCTVTVVAAQVADQDGTADQMAADHVFDFTITAGPQCGLPGATLISAIQGSGPASPEDGNVHIIEGIVVGDFQNVTALNDLNAFFLQEEDTDADSDAATSEGIQVYEGTGSPTGAYAVGDKLRVTGTVDEFNGLTQIIGPLTIEVCSAGNALPAATPITLPVAPVSDLERYEGMLVTFPDELTVTDNYTLGQFGEILLASGGRLDHPTQVAQPGVAAQAVRSANLLRSILLDDGFTTQNPDPLIHPDPGGLSASNTLRGGDTTTGLTGIMHYAFNTYRIQPTGPITWDHENARPVTPPAVGGTLKVASFNVLNYFITLGSRGASDSIEFTRQHDKIINTLYDMNADIIGLIELENHSGADPANDDSDPVLESIVDALNTKIGADIYDFIDAGVIGTDEIKTAFIYKHNSVTPVGDFAILDSSYDPAFIDTRNRPVLAQSFQDDNGEIFTVAVTHLKSKGSDCGGLPDDRPDTSGGNCNGTRTAAAQVMVDWFASDPTNSGDPDVLLIGDLNSYAKEDPIAILKNAGYTDLGSSNLWLGGRYSYSFDGEWGYLDYALASPSLSAQVVNAAAWHTNADEPRALEYEMGFTTPNQDVLFYSDSPFRASDHDPIMVGLNPSAPANEAVYISTKTAGTVGALSYRSDDILKWDGSAWSKWFDGQAAGLTPSLDKHNINAFWIPDPNGEEVIISFAQNRWTVPDITGWVEGMDLVRWDGDVFTFYFDGSDVGLTVKVAEKIDGLHIMPDTFTPPNGWTCQAYMLISTQGPGAVPNYPSGILKFSGEDVLGFCATNLGTTTAGIWHKVLDGSDQGLRLNAIDSIAASDDGMTLFLTTRMPINIPADGVSGGHSMVYEYDFGTQAFSGPYFSAPAAGINQQMDGLHMSAP